MTARAVQSVTPATAGHDSYAAALAEHNRRREQCDLANLRAWPGWIDAGRQAWCGECSCGSTLTVFREVEP